MSAMRPIHSMAATVRPKASPGRDRYRLITGDAEETLVDMTAGSANCMTAFLPYQGRRGYDRP